MEKIKVLLVEDEPTLAMIIKAYDLDENGQRIPDGKGGKDNIAIILIEPFTNEVETC